MKHSILSILLLGASLQAMAQQPFSISGNIPGLPKGATILLSDKEGLDPKKIAETSTDNGQFALSGEIKGPRMCSLSIYVPSKRTDEDGKQRSYSVASLRLMVDSSPITVTADTATLFADTYNIQKEAKVNIAGGRVQDEYNEFLSVTREAESAAQLASYAEANKYFEVSGDKSKLTKEIAEVRRTAGILEQLTDQFIEQHPQYSVSASLVAQRVYKTFTYTQQQMQHYIDLLKDNADTLHVNFLRRNQDLIMARSLGADYGDVCGQRPDDSSAKLSEQMESGRYTLVDFWASWCGPCRSAIPRVKKMYEDMRDNLQVVSISLDQKKDAWQKAEKAEAMPWPQLWVDGENYNTAVEAYAIQSIPRLVLISPKGKIVCVSHDPDDIKDKLITLIQ